MTQATDSAGAFNEAGARALGDVGIECALRYHYNLTRPEIDRLHAAGVGVGFIGEYDTLTWHPILAGYATARAQAADTVAKMQHLGFPQGCIAWATSDTGVAPSSYQAVEPYMQGWSEVVRAAGYRSGLYGGEGLIDWMLDRDLCDAGWAAGATSWNFGHRSDRVVLRQHVGYRSFGGTQCDMNDVLGDCGHWPAPGQATTGTPEGDWLDMATKEEVETIVKKAMVEAAWGDVLLAGKVARPYTYYKVMGDDQLWYLTEDPAGNPRRVKIKNPAIAEAQKRVARANTDAVELDPSTDAQVISTLESFPILVEL